MADTDAYLFASYSLRDREAVVPFIERLKALGVNIFYDASLRPGVDWEHSLAEALDGAMGLLVFVSPRSMQSKFVQQEIAAAVGEHRVVIPVIIEHTTEMAEVLKKWQWVDVSKASAHELDAAAARIADAVQRFQPPPNLPAIGRSREAQRANEEFAQDLRRQQRPPDLKSLPDSVFVVHGHDTRLLEDLEAYVKQLGIRPVVLKNAGGATQSLFQKFLQSGREARFAIVLLSADDLGASRIQFEADKVGKRALQFRAEQNVILELGFFYGYLGWENVFVLLKKPQCVFPNFERPSDIDGVVFDVVDSSGQWREVLRGRLADAGFAVTK